MKHLRYLPFLIVCIFFADISAIPAQTISTNASQNIPFSLGLVGGIARQFSTGRLASVPDLPRFPEALNEHNGTTLGGGIEALYRLNPSWELALRGEYGQLSATTTGEERTIISVWNPRLSLYQPTPALVRNTLTSNINLLSFTPLIRLFFGDVFFASIGARFDVPLQTSLRYRFDIDAPFPIAFVSTFTQHIDTALRLTPAAARIGFSWSPVVSVGASLAVGRVRFMPELQVQPLFQPLRGLTPENTPWNLVLLRFNLGIIFTFPAAKTTITEPIPPSAIQNTSQSTAPNSVQNPAQNASQSAPQEPSALVLQTAKPDTLLASEAPITFPMRLDTVFQRDTTTRVVAWNLPDTVRLEGKTTQSRLIPSGKQFAIAESYTRDVPKPKPFLVANLDVRFIPALGTARSAETQQAARLVEKPMMVRSLTASRAQETFSIQKTYDTLNIVRLPLVRFLPTISSEVGTRERLINIGSERSAQTPLLTIALPDAKPLDWDAQTLLLSPRPSNGLQTLIGDTLAVWMTVSDNEEQRVKTGTSRITVEHLDAATATQQTPARTKQPVAHWTLASFRVVVSDTASGQLVLASEAVKLRDYVLGEMARRKAQSKTSFKNCTVYGVLPASADTAGASTAKALAPLLALTRSLAEAFKTSSFYVIQSGVEPFANNSVHVPPMQHFDKKTYAFPRTDAYIRVMVEE